MKKGVWIWAIGMMAAAIIVIAQVVNHNQPTGGKPVVTIGVSLPLSGDLAYVGMPVKKSIELSLNDIKKERNLTYDYRLIVEDDAFDGKRVVLNYQRFKSIHHTNAVMGMWGAALPIIDQTEKDRIIHTDCSWGYDLGKGYYNLNHSTLPDEQLGVLIDQLKKRNVHTIGIIRHLTKGDEEMMALLKPMLQKEGIDIVFENMYKLKDVDFRVDLMKMKGQPADIVLLMLTSPSRETYMKQAAEAKYKPAYTTFNYFAHAPELFEGEWFVDDALGTPEFRAYFERETGELAGACTANVYDTVRLLVNGFEQAGNGKTVPDNKDVVREMLAMTGFEKAMTGTHIDAEGNIHSAARPMMIKNGKVVELKE